MMYKTLDEKLLLVLFICLLLSGCSGDFHDAAKKGDIEKVKKYIADGHDVNATNKDGESVLWVAVMGENIEVVKLLIKAGADLSLQDPRTGTPLHVAAAKGNYDIAIYLIENGANVNEDSHSLNETPIWLAIQWRHIEVVKLLINKGANVNDRNIQNACPIHRACMGPAETIELLISHGANVNSEDYKGRTPLFYATNSLGITEFGFEGKDMITVLFNNGADLNHKSKKGETALDEARRWNMKVAVDILEKLHEKNSKQIN